MSYKLIIVIIILIILILNYHRVVDNTYENYEKVKYFNIKDNFRTGDIILVVHDYIRDFDPIRYSLFNVANYYLSSSIITHAALVVVIDGKNYLYHTHLHPGYDHYTGKYKYKYVGIEEFEHQLNTVSSEFIYYSYKGPDIHDQVMEIINKHMDSNIKYTINPINFLNTLLIGKKEINNSYICTQLLAEVLQTCGVFDSSIPPHKFNTRDIELAISNSKLFDDPKVIENLQYYCRKYGLQEIDQHELN